jgi:peptide/nickel transport system substrate-binding protein
MSRRDFLHAGMAGGAGLYALAAGMAARQAEAQAAPKPPKSGGTLIWGMESEIGPLDVQAVGGWVTWRVRRQIYEPLVTHDLTKEGTLSPAIVPALATSWEVSPDGRVYTFHLRQNVKFHDGTPFNAEAVKVNLDRALDEKSPYFNSQLSIAQKRYIYQYIESYQVLDPFTIQLTNRVPFPDFLFQMAELGYAAFVSPIALQKWGNNDLAEHPVGTGPFRLVERVRGQKVVLERNPDYWGRKPYLNRIIFRPLPEAASRVVALQTGEADLIMVPPPDSVEQLKKAGFIVHQSPTAHIWYWNLCMNKEPLKDIRVRRAIQHAIDKEGLARNLMQGTVLPAHQMHAPGAPAYDSEFKMYEYNPEKAKQLLAEAGYANGLKLTWTTSVDGSGQLIPVPITEWIQRDLRKVGIEIEIVAYEWQSYLGMNPVRCEKSDSWQMSWGEVSDYWLYKVMHSKYNTAQFPRSYYKNPEIDTILDRAASELDDQQRHALYRQANRQVMEDAAFVPIVHDLAPVVYHPKVKGFVHTALESFDLTTLWLDA